MSKVRGRKSMTDLSCGMRTIGQLSAQKHRIQICCSCGIALDRSQICGEQTLATKRSHSCKPETKRTRDMLVRILDATLHLSINTLMTKAFHVGLVLLTVGLEARTSFCGAYLCIFL